MASVVRTAMVLVLAALVVGCAAHPHGPSEVVVADLPEGPIQSAIITGQGKFQYQYDATKFVLPKGVQLLNAHGLAMSHVDGSIYFTYESVAAAKALPETRALIRYNADGTNGTLLGRDNTLAQGVPHGIKLAVENGIEYLYHANNDAIVAKTDLEGNIIWRHDMTAAWSKNSEFWPFKPTDVVLPPGLDQVYVADGYGSSKVHGFDTKTGNYTGLVFGGKGKQDKPILFNCDHGISFDTRVNQLVVSDRANGRLRWVDYQGNLLNTTAHAEVPLPCNAQTSNGTVLGGDYLIVPGLGESVSGSAFIYDKSNDIISTLEINKYLGATGSKHPHDAIFLQNGDVAIVCWAPGTITYWTHLKTEEE